MTDVSRSDSTRLHVNTLWAEVLVDELARCGLRYCCISPGSRSTPLVAAADRHEAVEAVSIIDERSSAFYGLGLARATDRPVALLCTSGTAAANWMPAVCEADRAGVPLLLLTADRPPRLRDTGASQSMDQLKLFGDRVRWFHAFDRPEAERDAFRYLRSTIDFAWEKAEEPSPGPVHLNCPFRKPLDPIPVEPSHRDAVPEDFEPPEPSDDTSPSSGFSTGVRSPTDSMVEGLAQRLDAADRPLFLCGADRRGRRYGEPLCGLARDAGAPVVAEPTSGVRFGAEAEGIAPVVGTGDFLFDSSLYAEAGAPDLIVQTGEAPLNWAGRDFVDRMRDVERISIQPSVQRRDPDHAVDHHLVVSEPRLFRVVHSRVLTASREPTDWQTHHRRVDETAREALAEAVTETDGLDEPRAWWALRRALPDPASLFVSNSMPVRNLDLYMPDVEGELDVYFNRGLNGIDGIESTGLGVARGTEAPTVVVTGDVAFRHDVGSLATAARTGANVTFLVIDNGGGAIFDELPISECGDLHERHFVTDPDLDVEAVADGFEAAVEVPEDVSDLQGALERRIGDGEASVIWVKTDRGREAERGESIRRHVVEAIDREVERGSR